MASKKVVSLHENLAVDELREFKGRDCDENKLIAKIIKGMHHKLPPVILDVGAGLGDIAREAYPEIQSVLLDINEVAGPISPNHARMVGDFFDFLPKEGQRISTLVMSHVTQYLDDEPTRLAKKIRRLSPDVIVDVSNTNDDAFGEIMRWSLTEISEANPEVQFDFSLSGAYRLDEEVLLTARLFCPDFSVLAHHMTRVLVDGSPKDVAKMERKLRTILRSPEIEIHQAVRRYEKID